jgi:uncharacterized protein (TIGR02271 family)
VSETIPVIAEEIEGVGTREVETARVRIRKRVLEDPQTVTVPLRRDEVEIERVSVNRVVDQVSPIRYEGDVTIVPVFEEVLVRQLVLKEEVRVRRRSTTEPRESEPVVLLREEVEVTRTPNADVSDPAADRHPTGDS